MIILKGKVKNIMNFDELEKFRTKEELVKYFEEKGKNITEEEIEALKRRYEETEKKTGVLSLGQLDEIAGGSRHLSYRGECTSKSSGSIN